MADTKLSNLPAIATGDIDNNVLIYCVDVTGGNISSKVTRSALYLDIANIFTKGQTISPVLTTGLIINPSSAPVGSSSSFHGGLSIASGTVGFITTAQTGDYNTARIDVATLTNPSSGTIPNASSLKIIGPPVASTNVVITNAYSLWVAGGTTLLQATTIATTLLVQGQTTHSTTTNTGIIINPPTAPTGSSSEFIGALSKVAGTIQFASTTQTGDFVSTKYGQDTLTNTSPGTITNASTLKIVGAPIASTNVTITNNYALWVAGGNSLFAGTLTSTGGITMSSADITLGTNVLKTSHGNLNEVGGGAVLQWQANSGNNQSRIYLAPSGSSTTAFHLISRTNSISNEAMLIGSDVVAATEFALQIIPQSGSVRPWNIYMNTTKLLSFDTANTITSYVDFLQTTGKKISLNVGGTSYLIETSANQIDTFANSIQAHRVVVGATTTTEVNNVFGRLGALATNSADGFVYMPSGAGTPTGTPTAFTGKVAFYYDTTNNIIYIYNGAWKKTAALT